METMVRLGDFHYLSLCFCVFVVYAIELDCDTTTLLFLFPCIFALLATYDLADGRRRLCAPTRVTSMRSEVRFTAPSTDRMNPEVSCLRAAFCSGIARRSHLPTLCCNASARATTGRRGGVGVHPGTWARAFPAAARRWLILAKIGQPVVPAAVEPHTNRLASPPHRDDVLL